MRGYPEKFESPGELNWDITEVIKRYVRSRGVSYTTYNDIVGALECAKQEFYRRIIVPYEEERRKINGDVY